MKITFYIFVISLVWLNSQACQRQRPTPKKEKAEIEIIDTTPAVFDTLVKRIPTIQTPVDVDIEKYMTGSLEKKYLEAFFIGKPYKTDADKTEIFQWTKDLKRNWYYLHAPYATEHWIAFVIYNSEIQAFFICIFTRDGKMIDALKLAFLSKNEKGALAFKATLTTQKTIQMKGTFMSKDLDTPDADYALVYQIGTDGHINREGTAPAHTDVSSKPTEEEANKKENIKIVQPKKDKRSL